MSIFDSSDSDFPNLQPDYKSVVSSALLGQDWAKARLYQAIEAFYPDTDLAISDFDQAELCDILRAYSE